MMAPNMEKPMMNPTPEVAVKVRFLNSQSGMMGSEAVVSIQQKMPSEARATSPMPMMTGEPQAYSEPAQVVSRMMQVTPTERKAVPAQSILCGTRLTGMWSTAATTKRATMPSGRLM